MKTKQSVMLSDLGKTAAGGRKAATELYLRLGARGRTGVTEWDLRGGRQGVSLHFLNVVKAAEGR